MAKSHEKPSEADTLTTTTITTTVEAVVTVPPVALLRALVAADLIPALPPEVRVQLVVESGSGTVDEVYLTPGRPLRVRWTLTTVARKDA